jgi:hypothetical protein
VNGPYRYHIEEAHFNEYRSTAEAIYKGRLDVSEAEIVKYLENLVTPDRDCIYWRYVDGLFDYPKNMSQDDEANRDKEWEEECKAIWGRGDPERVLMPGQIHLTTCWKDNTWIHIALIAYHDGNDDFLSGFVDLTRAYPTKDKPIDVGISSCLSRLRPFWIDLARLLRAQFREKRKGGPHATPKEKQIEAVLGWRAVLGTMPQELYCSTCKIPVTAKRLQQWETALEAEGLIPKRRRR